MALIKKYRPGAFCWADLGATDVSAAKKFYKGIFGWTAKEISTDGGTSYSYLCAQGKEICGIYPMSAEERKMKLRPSWLPYISVGSADRIIRKAKAAGATLCLGPVDVKKHGRLAIFQDPAGAEFAIWQPRTHPGTKLKEVPGTICWHDLNTSRRKAAGKFYPKVFGWKIENVKFSGNPYHLFKVGGEGIGGMWPAPLPKHPPAWFTYWVVTDCAKTAAKTKRLKGKVVLGPITVPDTCTFAILRDPQGAEFGVLEPI